MRGNQYKNGKIFYEGEWVNDKMEGYGKIYIDIVGYYIGEFKGGDINGKGTMYDKNGKIIYSGIFYSKKIIKMMNIPFD